MKREPIIDPAIEQPLLGLHRATNIDSFWKAARRLLSTAIPNQLIKMTFQHNPVLPTIARKTRPLPNDFFAAEPLRSHVSGRPRKRFVRISDLFANRSRLIKSVLYRRYLAPHHCRHGVILFFWKNQRLICAITIMRTAAQGDLAPAEMKLLRQLYRQFRTALHGLGLLEREQSARTALEELVRRLPLPTILLRWNLKPVYQNRAARDFCSVWEKGPSEARRTKPRPARDIRSLPSTQTKMAAFQRAADAYKKRSGASSAIAPSASDYPIAKTELGRGGAATFSDRVRKFGG